MYTVLVVEDMRVKRELISQYLTQAGITVISASNGKDALRKVIRHRPDIVISDIVMPEMNGFELCRHLKECPGTQAIPVIVYSTQHNDSDQHWAVKNGVDRYLAQPFNQAELVQLVKSTIQELGGVQNGDPNASELVGLNVKDLVNILKYVHGRSRYYLGPTIANRYLNATRPDFDWLQQFLVEDNKPIRFSGSLEQPLNVLDVLWFRKWLNSYINQCAQTILNFHTDLDPVELLKLTVVTRALNRIDPLPRLKARGIQDSGRDSKLSLTDIP